MKKNFFIFALMLIAVGMPFTVVSCSSDDGENGIEEMVLIGNVQTETGTICYNENVGRWYIYCVNSGTIDSVSMYFPLQLKADLRKIGICVTFSGKNYEPDFPIQTPQILAPQNLQYVVFLYVPFKVIAVQEKFVLHLNFVALINIAFKFIRVFSSETPFFET